MNLLLDTTKPTCQRTRLAHICRQPAVAKYRDPASEPRAAKRWRYVCAGCLGHLQAGRRERIEVEPV